MAVFLSYCLHIHKLSATYLTITKYHNLTAVQNKKKKNMIHFCPTSKWTLALTWPPLWKLSGTITAVDATPMTDSDTVAMERKPDRDEDQSSSKF